MNLLVVGAGEMGRWFARALVADAPAPVTVTFVDADPDVSAEAAASLGEAATAVEPDAASAADLVCVAVPIPAASEAVERYAPLADRAIVDVTGTMTAPVAAMRKHAPDCERLSLHPLFAPENEPGNVPAVVDESGPVTEAVLDALDVRGNDAFETTPAEHDQAMETVQARTHTAVLAYALAAEPVDDRFHTPISAPLEDLAEQVAGGDARVYADIQAAFEGADDVAAAARRIADSDAAEFEALYGDAAE